MTVREFIKKWGIKVAEMEIYVTSMETTVYRPYEMEQYYESEVITAYKHKGDTVIQVA